MREGIFKPGNKAPRRYATWKVVRELHEVLGKEDQRAGKRRKEWGG